MQDLLGDLASGPAVAGPPPVAEDLSNVPGAQGPPREVHDTTNEPQEDVEVRCHARATTGKMPPSRYLHTANTVAERLIVYGGKGPHGPLGDVHVLDMKMSAWMQAKPTGDLPAPRFGHTSVAQGTSQLIVFGGMASGHSTFSFQPGTPKPAIPLPFASNQRGEAERHAECEDELYTLDLETFEWVQQTGAKGAVPSPRYKHSATPIPERKGRVRMFVFGGCDDEHVALNDQYSLDCETMEWSEVQTSGTTPSPRFGHSATWLPSRKILLLGGSNGAKSESEHGAPDPEIPPHKTTKSLLPMGLNMLDIDTMTWSQPTARGAGTGAEPSPRCFHSAALCGKNLFVLGGQVHHWLLANNHYVHGTYILETTKLQWEHNTIKGDSFIPYPGASLLGHTGTAADSSSLYLGFGIVESTASHEYSRLFWDIATDAKQKLNPSLLPKPTQSGAYNTTFKLLCVGDAGVGKTCLIMRFVEDSYSETNKSTIGVDFKTLQMEMDAKPVNLQLWDTAGQERFRSLTAAYYRGAHGVVLVYDVTDAQTFENLVGWMKDVDNYCGEEAVKLLIGNKSDQEAMRAVPLEQAKEFAHEHGLLFMEASAKVATNVKAAFRLLVAEVMYKADTLANQPPAFQEKVKLHAERSKYRTLGLKCCQ